MHRLHAPVVYKLQSDAGVHARHSTISRRVVLLRCVRLSALCGLQRAATSAEQIRHSKDATLEMRDLHREAAVRALWEQAENATEKCRVRGLHAIEAETRVRRRQHQIVACAWSSKQQMALLRLSAPTVRVRR